MLEHRSFQNFKKFLDTGVGRFSVVVFVAVVLLLATVLPSMLTVGVTDKDRELAAAVVDLSNAENKVLKGNINARLGGVNADISVNISAKSLQESRGELGIKASIGANTFDIPVEFVYNNADKEQYYKISNLDGILEAALNPDAPVYTSINNVAQKIDGNWLRLSSENVEGVTANTAAENLDECTPQLFSSIQTDPSAKESIAELLASDTLFSVDSVNSVDGGNEYNLVIDSDEAEKAIDVLKGTELFKNTDKCDDSYNPFKSQIEADNAQSSQQSAQNDNKPVVKLKLIVNGKNQITSIVYSSQSSSQVLSVNLTVDSNQNIVVALPKSDIVDYSTISDEVSSIFTTLSTPPQNANSPAGNLVQPYGGM